MSPEQTKAIAVRLDLETIQKIELFASHNNFVNDDGGLNMSAALRVLISSALNESPEHLAAQVWQSAKGVAMREVTTRIFEVLKDYRDK